MNKKRREEEEKLLAEMDEAMREIEAKKEEGSAGEKGKTVLYGQPETVHCRRCKTVMEKGVCPSCGLKIYMPTDEGKRKKIRKIATVICLAVFVVILVVVQVTKN